MNDRTSKELKPKGRPITNKIDQIPAPPEDIAKAMFKAADKKFQKKKPN